MARFGRFDDERREYVIETPETPLPWLNYLGSDDLIAIVSNTAAGYTFSRDARLRRLTRFRYNAAPLDTGARYVYLRDDDSGEAWSPTGQPLRVPLDTYECRHGLGYTVIASRRVGIDARTTLLIPPGDTVEVWRVRLTNRRAEAASLSLFAGVEWCLWDANDDATNFQRNYSTGEVLVADGVVYHVTEYRERRDHFAWFASSEPPTAFDTSRDAFLGPGHGWDRPLAVERGACTGSMAHGWQPIAMTQVRLHLAPGESREVVYLTGYTENPPDAKFDKTGKPDRRRAREVIERYTRPGAVDAALDELREGWTGLLGSMQVATPDPDLDRMLNTWNAYQCMVTFNLSRSASLFESGIGRGMGFRDSNQDLLGFVHLVPERARQRLCDLAATQLPDGGAWHQYQPLTKRGNDAIGAGFSDDPAWLVLAVGAYVRETGDDAVLTKAVPFDNTPGTEAPLFEHLQRAITYTLERLGPHRLPLIGRADWNDCLNLNCFSTEPGESFQTTENREGGVAESVFTAGLFVLAAREMEALAGRCGDVAEAHRCGQAAAAMVAAIDAHGWDGAWFLRAYDHSGAAIGSAANEEGQIFAEPQGICPMAGIGLDDGRALAALASVRERLASPHGVALVRPPYTRYHPELGEISSYPPGYKENGGVFCHVNPWLVIAEARVGHPEQALDYHRRINPSVREAISEIHRCEPYVYAQMIAGPDAATHGEAKNSWLTGTAAWSFVAASQWILGIRPEHDGLRIDPVVPEAWPAFEVVRRFRGATYRIRVQNPDGVAGRVQRLRVNGEPVEGSLAPLPARPGETITVEARIEP